MKSGWDNEIDDLGHSRARCLVCQECGNYSHVTMPQWPKRL